jgi:hypothetical protein
VIDTYATKHIRRIATTVTVQEALRIKNIKTISRIMNIQDYARVCTHIRNWKTERVTPSTIFYISKRHNMTIIFRAPAIKTIKTITRWSPVEFSTFMNRLPGRGLSSRIFSKTDCALFHKSWLDWIRLRVFTYSSCVTGLL